jgi:pimeloyl-ACP methyl ester carboxylesterase
MPTIRVDSDRVELFYEIIGAGPEKVLFVVGLATSYRSWRYQSEFFSSDPSYQVCILENRGVGRSSSPVGLYSTKRLARDVYELMVFLGWERFHLVGLSMGGMIALELSFMLMNRVKSLSLLVTHAGGFTGVVPLLTVAYVLRNLKRNPDPEEWAEFLLPLCYSKKWLSKKYVDENGVSSESLTNRDVIKSELRQIRVEEGQDRLAGHFGQVAATLRHYVSYSRLQTLRDSGIPILIMTGNKDRLVRFQNSFLLRDALRPRSFVLLDGAGHMIHEEASNKVNAILLDHFEFARNIPLPKSKL